MEIYVKILITGANGQLGQTIVEIIKSQNPQICALAASKSELNIADKKALSLWINRYKPDIFLNLAAYNNVTKAEFESEQANLINNIAVGYIAELCKAASLPLIHISTDYVFNSPNEICSFREESRTNPVNTYGKSKLAGENNIRDLYQNSIILRSSWIISNKETSNFFKKICTMASEKNELFVVNDQHGTPTTTESLSIIILRLIEAISNGFNKWGTYHYCDQPQTTWYGLAKVIIDQINLKFKKQISVTPITANEFEDDVKRPFCSILDCDKIKKALNVEQVYWPSSIKKYILG